LHGRTDKDSDFASRYGGATLTDMNGRRYSADETLRTAPMNDAYLGIGSSIVTRWLAQITYRFRLDPGVAPETLTFAFTDDRGTEHRYPLTLAKFR
jgi:hypothetical protein